MFLMQKRNKGIFKLAFKLTTVIGHYLGYFQLV